MKIVRDLGGRQDGNIFGQPCVERRHQPIRRDPPVGVKAHHLTFGVGARVGSTRRIDHMVLTRDRAQSSLQLGFHGPSLRLLLPAREVRAVVFQHDFDIHFLNGIAGLRPSP